MEKEKSEIKEVGTINTKEEPDVQNIRSSSNKNKPITDYHRLSEKYSILNNFKNVGIGIAVAVTLLVNGWIEVNNRILQLLAATVMAVIVVIMAKAIDEIIMEE